jgi:hypothetical protein
MTTHAGPSPDLKRRVLGAVAAAPAPTRSEVRRRGWLAFAVSAAIALAIFAEAGGLRLGGRPGLLVVSTCVGWILATSAAAAFGVARGRSTPGRSTGALLVLLVALPVALLAWKVGVSLPFGAGATAPWPGRPGFRCLGLSLAMAAPLLAALVVMRRGSDPVHPAVAGAMLGLTAAIAAGALVDLWCPVAYLPHVLLGHILPLAIVAAVGAWTGRRMLAP